MSMNMKQDLVAALNASFSAGGWRTVSAHLSEYSATLQVENKGLGLFYVFVLGGLTEDGYTTVTLNKDGTHKTDNGTLVARLAATINPALNDIQDGIIAELSS